MGAEMVVIGDLDTLSEYTLVGVVSNLLKNRFSSVADSRSPCTLGAGLMQPAIRFIPFQAPLPETTTGSHWY